MKLRALFGKHNPAVVVAATLLASSPFTASAHWTVNPAQSQLSFVSVKAGNVGEVHRFTAFTGGVDDDGALTLTIDLTSVDTLIPIRDERMQTILFDTAQFPAATFTAKLTGDQLQAAPAGGSATIDVAGKLSLHGESVDVSASLLIVRLTARRAVVTTLKPILLNAGAFGLTAGIEQLREIAGLPAISLAVPVTFTLTLDG